MEENKIHLINQIDLNKLIYSKVNEMNDKKLIHVYYEKPGQKLLFQTPQLLNIFDIQKSQYFNELIVPLYDCNLKVPLLTQFLKDLDSKIVEGARTNKNEWFKNKSAIRYKSLIKNLYTSQSNSQHYSPSKEDEKYSTNGLIKLKLTNGIKILENNNEIKLEDLQKNNYVRLIVELYGIWVSNEVFGIYLKPVMIEQIQNQVINFVDEKDDIAEVNLLETEANTDDEFIDQNDLKLVARNNLEARNTSEAKNKSEARNTLEAKNKSETIYKSNIMNKLNTKNISDTSTEKNTNSENTKMYQFGLHDINEDLFNTLKKDKKIASILSELNSNNTKKDIALSEMSSDIEDDNIMSNKLKNILSKNESEVDDESEENDESEGSDESEENDSDTSIDIAEIKINRNTKYRN
jgi:hypothetical protein